MKKTTKLALFVGLVLLACALMFTACDSNNETPTTNEPNDTKTEETTSPTITVEDGYLVVNGVKTEHKIHTTDEITVNTDGYVVVNGVATNIVADKDDVITIDNDGYVIVNGVKTEYEIKNKNHNFSEWELYNEFETDCEKKLFYRVCSDCSTIEWKDGKPEDHKFQTVTTVATCISGGYDTKTCTVCNKIIICNETPVSSTNHSFGDWYESIKVTCTTDGKDERTCVCGTKETRIVPALGDAHTPVVDEAVAPTYTTRGKTEGSHCSSCGIIIVEQRDIATVWNGSVVQPTQLVTIDDTYYYQINSAEELAFLVTAPAEWKKYNFVLNCDIWLNIDTLMFDEESNITNNVDLLHKWDGFECQYFDGANHQVRGIYSVSGGGFITKCDEVKNLNVTNSYIYSESGQYIGGISNYIDRFATNCSFDGTVIGRNYIGGIAGFIDGHAVYPTRNCINYGCIIGKGDSAKSGGITGGIRSWLIIDFCVNYGKIASDYCAGGLIGFKGGAFDCTNYGNVVGSKYVGGIIGYANTNFERNINYGNVTGYSYTGGCVGYFSENFGLGESINKGTVLGNDYVGGIAGYSTTDIYDCKNWGSVEGSENIGGISGYAADIIDNSQNFAFINGVNYVGGISGYSENTLSNCANTGNITGNSNIGGVVGYFDVFAASKANKNCYYLKTASTNANLKGIGNLEDSAGVCEAKNEDFFEQE